MTVRAVGTVISPEKERKKNKQRRDRKEGRRGDKGQTGILGRGRKAVVYPHSVEREKGKPSRNGSSGEGND